MRFRRNRGQRLPSDDLQLEVAESSAELTAGPLSSIGLRITSGTYQLRAGLVQVVVNAEAVLDETDPASAVPVHFDAALLAHTPRQAVSLAVVAPNARLSVAARCETTEMIDGGILLDIATAGHAPLVEEGEEHLPDEAVGAGVAGVLRLRFRPT